MTDASGGLAAMMQTLGIAARAAFADLAQSTNEQRNGALRHAATALRDGATAIMEANRRDMHNAEHQNMSSPMLNRLMLDSDRIAAIADAVAAIGDLPNTIGKVLAQWERPNGLSIQRVAVPLGVVGIIYESRPNVTADAAALCIKSGNAVILRGGSDSFHSSQAIYECVRAGLISAGITADSVQMVGTRDREAVAYLLSSMAQWLDVVIPRGGKSLIKRVQEEARVPVIGHLEGLCHVYLHAAANTEMARDIVLNAKMRRTGICGAAETVLVDRSVAAILLPGVCGALIDAGCEIRGDEAVQEIVQAAIPAKDDDWAREYLDAIISIRVVDNIDAAIAHIAEYGSAHTDSIVTDDTAAAEKFLRSIDSAIVLHNASTQYADGGEFGMCAEIGIATGRVHARGPVGAEQLTSYKYVIRGSGQVRP